MKINFSLAAPLPLVYSGRMKRLPVIDALRGLMIVFMIVSHSETVFSGRVGLYMIALSTEAEVFVFLSGLVVGFLYLSRGTSIGGDFKVVMRRLSRIYLYHILLLAGVGACFVLLAVIGLKGVGMVGKFGFGALLSSPEVFSFTGLALLHQPKYMDILPIFLFTTLITPVALRLIEGGRGKVLLGVSALLWGVTQFLPSFAEGVRSVTGLSFLRLGFADIMAWQFLYIIAVYAGCRYEALGKILLSRRGVIFCLAVCALCLALRWMEIFYKLGVMPGLMPDLESYPLYLWLTNKTNLGLLRLVNFLALGIVFWKSCHVFGRYFPSIPFLSTIGLYGLQSYAYHIFAVYAFFFVRGALGFEDIPSMALRVAIETGALLVLIAGAGVFASFLHRRAHAAKASGKNTPQ